MSFLKKKNRHFRSHGSRIEADPSLEFDRNHRVGGRSFYFFDFDDNIAILSTPGYLFHKKTGKEIKLTSSEFAMHSAHIGVSGKYKDYEINFCDQTGTFRNYRDSQKSLMQKLLGKKQAFVRDLNAALLDKNLNWKGPSWSCFYHAVKNHRPISLITARGHKPETIKQGIDVLIRKGNLPNAPNYLSIYPVNNPEIRAELGFTEDNFTVPKLKQAAIRASVEQAFKQYGMSPFHRFGMSDDDPKNIELIIEEMKQLKNKFSENSFYVIDTSKGRFVKREVFSTYVETEYVKNNDPLTLVQEK